MKVISPCVKILFCIVGSDITTKTGTTYKYCVPPRTLGAGSFALHSAGKSSLSLSFSLFGLSSSEAENQRTPIWHHAGIQQICNSYNDTTQHKGKCKQIRLTCDRRRLGWRSHSLDEPEQVTDERILQRTQQTVSYQVLLANCYR